MKVSVYFNLHKRLFSIRAEEGPKKGRVIGHSSFVLLRGATFKVSEAGRQRVLRERRKNVHAVVKGELVASQPGEGKWADLYTVQMNGEDVTYNPYKWHKFHLPGREISVDAAKLVRLSLIDSKPTIKALALTVS